MEKVYIQTYSVHEAMTQDFKGSLKRIADLGYSGIEFAGGYGGLPVKELKKYLTELSLDPISSHVSLEEADAHIEYLAELGARYMICPMASPASEAQAYVLADRLNKIGERCAKAGITYGYHNHTQEFAVYNGQLALDILIENTDPKLVTFELDAGWCACSGNDPIEYIKKHAGRFRMIHAKECCKVVGVSPVIRRDLFPKDENGRPIYPEDVKQRIMAGRMANGKTGTGIFDWKALKKVADAQGAIAYIVERELAYDNKDIFECIKEDIDYLKTV